MDKTNSQLVIIKALHGVDHKKNYRSKLVGTTMYRTPGEVLVLRGTGEVSTFLAVYSDHFQENGEFSSCLHIFNNI